MVLSERGRSEARAPTRSSGEEGRLVFLKLARVARVSQCHEIGGNNSLLTGDGSVWRRHSTNSSAKATVETKNAKHAPALSNNPRPPKLRTQITVAVEHSQMAINDAQ